MYSSVLLNQELITIILLRAMLNAMSRFLFQNTIMSTIQKQRENIIKQTLLA